MTDSSSAEEPVAESKDAPVMTRKLTQKSEADAILDSDPSFKPLNGFDGVDGAKRFEIDEGFISDSSDGEFIPPLSPTKKPTSDLIFYDGLSGQGKLVPILKKMGGGKPKLVPPAPAWLVEMFSKWYALFFFRALVVGEMYLVITALIL